MRFSDEFLATLRSRIDITELIGRYTEVRNPGSTRPVCLCPFHSEKTPSFVIYTNTQSFYCFGCQTGGDAIAFIKNIERLDYTEAVRFLCERYNVPMPAEQVDDTYTVLRRRCYEANREAARFFNSCLSAPEGRAGLDYLRSRSLTDETVRHFGLGFAPDSWSALTDYMRKKGYDDTELVTFNLARRSQKGNIYDNFRNRVIFPIIDIRGNVVAFGGRVLDDSKPKYLNTTDTVVYKKGQGIYALNFAKNARTGRLIVCEGYMDAIAMHQAGFTDAVAALGTAFTPEQISLLSRYCSELVLSFDSDEAGQKAAARAMKLLGDSPVTVRIMTINGGKDPDEIIKSAGAAEMEKTINSALGATEYALKKAAMNKDISSETGKAAYLREAISVIAAVPGRIEREVYVSKLSSETGVSVSALRDELTREIKKQRGRQRAEENMGLYERVSGRNRSMNPDFAKYTRAVNAEETLLAYMLKHPDYFGKLSSELSADTFVTEYSRKFYKAFSSRLERGDIPDISAFGADAQNEEVSYMAYLISKGDSLSDTLKECRDCIAVLVSEKTRREASADIGSVSDEEFAEKMKKLRELKGKR